MHSVFVYFIALLYALVVSINFIAPIAGWTAGMILALSAAGAWAVARWAPLDMPEARSRVGTAPRRGPRWMPLVGVCLCVILGGIVVSRSCIGVDSNMYHLPISILCNQSIWYPGIGNLNDAYGILHGNSILAASFTAIGWSGSENIINYAIWCYLIYFIGRLCSSFSWPMWLSAACALMIGMQYNILSAAFNMGNDLGQTAFMCMSMVLLFRGARGDALLLMAIAASFRITAQAGYALLFLYLLAVNRNDLLSGRALFSYLLVILAVARTFVGTGMLAYPVELPFMSAPEWGVPADMVADMGRSMLNVQPRVEYSLAGLGAFWLRYFVVPKTVRSAWWFSPVFVVSAMACTIQWRRVTDRARMLNRDQWAAVGLAFGILLFWILTKPQFRYAAGAWVFATVGLMHTAWRVGSRWQKRIVASATLCVCALFFAREAGRYSGMFYHQWRAGCGNHINSLTMSSMLSGRTYDSIVELRRTSLGEFYMWTDGNLIGRTHQPVVSRRTMRNDEDVVHEFYRWNRNAMGSREKFISMDQRVVSARE
jgi:hypothetical protein